jgi:uncharacterized membrane protein required for colicin V production
MIAAATQQIASGKMLFNWFDVALVLVVVFGFWRGRRNGMTKEIVPVTQWLAMVIAGAAGYKALGRLLIDQGCIKAVFGKSVTEETAGFVASYLIITAVVFTVFSLVKHRLKHRLEGSSFFGSSEYYFGMVSGVLRYLCMVIFALALLNAPYYSQAEITQQKYLANKNFGGGLAGYSGDFFPTLSEVQTSVFKDSLAGPFIKDSLSVLLIKTGSAVAPPTTHPVIYFGQ